MAEQEDLYGDGDSPTPDQAPPAEEPAADTDPKADVKEGKTALLDESICPGMKPGDEVVLKIVGVHDGQYSVSYSPAPKEESPEPGEPGESPAPADAPGAGGGSLYE